MSAFRNSVKRAFGREVDYVRFPIAVGAAPTSNCADTRLNRNWAPSRTRLRKSKTGAKFDFSRKNNSKIQMRETKVFSAHLVRP